VGTIRQFYKEAPFVARYLPELEELLHRPWTQLVDLDLAVTALLCRWLGLSRRIERSSQLGVKGERSDRLLALCRRFSATRYLSGDVARTYLDISLFERDGIAVEFQSFRHPTYSQIHGPFVPYLSVLDLLLNCGDESPAVLGFGRVGRLNHPGP
jgi:hypothetical protein